jgi:hypothetical protein
MPAALMPHAGHRPTSEPEAARGWTVDLHGPTGLRVIGPGGALYDGDLQVAPVRVQPRYRENRP